MFRAFVLLVAMVALAWLPLKWMVDQHVAQVVTAHAEDKAAHMVDMIAQTPGAEGLFAEGHAAHASMGGFMHMAHDTDILDMTFYSLDLRAQMAMNMADHSHDMVMDAAPVEDLRPVLETGQPMVQILNEARDHGGGQWFADVAVAVPGATGAPLGIVRFRIEVDKIRAAYARGLDWFAALLTGFGVLLFSVPALGYMAQKNVAEKSRGDAKYLASFDALTGLYNRGEFMTRADEMLKKGDAYALAFLDADNFKAINDVYGHAIGDAYLAQIASVLRTRCIDADVISRFGGDEFVIMFSGVSPDRVVHRVKAMLSDCAREVDLGGVTVSGSVSIGLAYHSADMSLDALLGQADVALYFAKAEGRNTSAVYNTEMGRDMARRRALEARLREAVDIKDFEIHYQPLIDAKSQNIIGYEALLRLDDAAGDPVAPDEFIPLAEEIGLIEEIGAWVIQQATQEIAGRSDTAMIAVNLSAEQFQSGKLTGLVKDALAESGLPAARLELEITESLLLDERPETELQIDALKDMGVSIAMDDFGTGFSSLSYLWKFGFDRIKIDRSFINAMDQNGNRSLELIESIIMLGDRLGMRITAEGIETQSQSDVLSKLGCDVLQGYYFGRPAPLGEAAESDHAKDDSVGPEQKSA